MKSVLTFTALVEIATGLALLAAPSLVSQLLLGQELSGMGFAVARVTGIALIGLAIACWPGPPAAGMLVYGAGVAAYLAYLGIANGPGGALLWPVVAVHVVLSVLLLRNALRARP